MRYYVSVPLFALVTACGPSNGGRGIKTTGADMGTSQGPPVGDAGVSVQQDGSSFGTLGDASCGGQAFAVTRVQPNVFLVLDRSASMTDPITDNSSTTKWSSLQTAITSLVTSTARWSRCGGAGRGSTPSPTAGSNRSGRRPSRG